MHSEEKMRLKSLRINCTILRHCSDVDYLSLHFLNASTPHERVETLLPSRGNGAGLPALFEPPARTRATGFCGLNLLEVKDFKQLCFKPQLAGSFNVRLDLRGGVWSSLGWEFLDIVLETQFPCAPIRQTQFITTRPRPLNCASVIQSFIVLNAPVTAEGNAYREFFF